MNTQFTHAVRRQIRIALSEAAAKKKLDYDSWRDLTDEEIAFEYMVEYRHVKAIYGDVWPDESDFASSVRDGDVKMITPAIDKNISYRSKTSSIAELEDLVSGYQYPRDIKRIVDGYKKNARLPYPIVLRDPKGNLRIMGGNSRMDAAFILGFNPRVLVVDIPKKSKRK